MEASYDIISNIIHMYIILVNNIFESTEGDKNNVNISNGVSLKEKNWFYGGRQEKISITCCHR